MTELAIFLSNKDYFKARFKHAVGHQFRLINESDAEEEILSFLKANPNTIFVDCDYAMKFLSIKFREKMSDFFGIKKYNI